jgi:predicted DNA-binding helix-hairpin-helix protein
MTAILSSPDTQSKLAILSQDSQYDLACSCGTNKQDHRRRSANDTWLYPVSLPGGGHSILFKTLVSNYCTNDCKYCPLRTGQDVRRCTLTSEETVRAFMSYWKTGKVFGLFLTNAVAGTPDQAMEQMLVIAHRLRAKERFRGYLHMKIIPGASDAAIEEAVRLSSAVSINLETAGEARFRQLSSRKRYMEDIIHPLKLISRLTDEHGPYGRVKQTTQFVVGAADETDAELLKYTWGLYRRLNLSRVYFSAYQRGLGEYDLPGEHSQLSNRDLLMREHRLYQADWLFRKYHFSLEEIPLDKHGNLPLEIDPKEHWAQRHPDFFPINVNRADYEQLLRVPGLGIVTVRRLLARRLSGARFRTADDLGFAGRRLQKAAAYLTF